VDHDLGIGEQKLRAPEVIDGGPEIQNLFVERRFGGPFPAREPRDPEHVLELIHQHRARPAVPELELRLIEKTDAVENSMKIRHQALRSTGALSGVSMRQRANAPSSTSISQ